MYYYIKISYKIQVWGEFEDKQNVFVCFVDLRLENKTYPETEFWLFCINIYNLFTVHEITFLSYIYCVSTIHEQLFLLYIYCLCPLYSVIWSVWKQLIPMNIEKNWKRIDHLCKGMTKFLISMALRLLWYDLMR